MPRKTFQLEFPNLGVMRRYALHQTGDQSGHGSPYSVNVRLQDPIARRLRGGSRPGLTRFIDHQFTTPVSAIVSVDAASSSGLANYLAVVAENYLGIIQDGALSTPKGYLLTEDGDRITTEDGDPIVVSMADIPADCFFVTRNGNLYAITTTAVYFLNLTTGVIETVEATTGTVPTGCTFGAVYRDRLLLAGGDNAIYASRQGNPLDWDYGVNVNDPTRAVSFQLSEAGEISSTPTALVPHRDALLLATTSDTLWVIQGNPAGSGTLRNVSRDVGIISAKAWCKAGDAVFFLASNGLYQVSTSGEGLANLSEDRIPEELRDIDASAVTVTMAYDHDNRGIHLFLTPAAGDGQHWFFDLIGRGFWPVVLQTDHQPSAVCQHGDEVLLAGGDGYVRTVGGDNDDGQNIESHLLIGPFQAARTGTYGRLLNLHGALAEGSGAVTWRVVTGDSAERACEDAKTAIGLYQAGDSSWEAYTAASGALLAGQSHMTYPRIRAAWVVIWLASTAKWAYETLTLETTQSGKVR